MAARTVQAGLVAGVDSLLNGRYIRAALRQGRLLTTAGTGDGLMPAEAAAVVLVRAGGRGIHIRGLGRGRETNTRDQDRLSDGHGLSQAMDQALIEARCPAHLINRRYADLNGEPYYFQEAAAAWARVLYRPSPPDHDPFLFAPYPGDVGAAIGPLCLAYALNAQRKFHSPGPWFLAHFANTDHRRGALVAVQGD